MLALYSNWLIKICLIFSSVVLGFITFGTPLAFEFASIILFAVVAYYRKSIDIKGVCFLLIADILLLNLIYIPYEPLIDLPFGLALTNPFHTSFMDSIGWACVSYLFVIYVVYQFWFDIISKMIAVLLCMAIAAEIYWAINGYDGPRIHFYFIKISVYHTIRQFLIYRPHNGFFFRQQQMKKLPIDRQILQIKSVSILVESLMICEYLLRHTLPQFTSIVFYTYYPFIMQLIAILIFSVVVLEAQKQLKLNQLDA